MLGLMTAACLAVMAFYLTLPGDPKNAVIWGLSYFRLGLTALSLVLTVLSGTLLGIILGKSRLSIRVRDRLSAWVTGETVFGFIFYHVFWLISSVYLYLRWFHFEWIATDMQIRVRPFLILWILLNIQLIVVWILLARQARPQQKLTAFQEVPVCGGQVTADVLGAAGLRGHAVPALVDRADVPFLHPLSGDAPVCHPRVSPG